MDIWPIRIKAEIHPARKKLTQWEIGCHDKSQIGQLPLNPYNVTCGTITNRNPGKLIECEYKYKNISVVGQFHRKLDNKSIWIGPNRYRSKEGFSDTDKWYVFLLSFGIKKDEPHSKIPVYLDFYSDFRVELRGRI